MRLLDAGLAPAAARPAADLGRPRRRAWAWGLGLALLAAVGLGLRLLLLVRAHWLLEGDDALSALMALGIQHGDRPLMLKNQTYAAAFEPYAMALSFSLLGVSRLAARLPELINSLLLIAAGALLARQVAGPVAAWMAAALLAVAPAYVLVLSLKPWAPYTEVILLGSLLLTCTVRLAWPPPPPQPPFPLSETGGEDGHAAHPLGSTHTPPSPRSLSQGAGGVRDPLSRGGEAALLPLPRRSEEAPLHPLPRRSGEGDGGWGLNPQADAAFLPGGAPKIAAAPRTASDLGWSFAGGLAGGLAFWMHPLAIWYLSTAAIVLLLRLRGRRRWLQVSAGGLPGLLLGATPFWLYNLHTTWSTFQFVLRGSQGQTADHAAVFAAWWNADLPRGAGLWHPWGSSPSWQAVLMASLLIAALAWSLLGRRRWALQPLDALLLLLLAIPTIFVFSGFGGPALNLYGFDATGRYAPPIWCALAVVLAAAGAAVWRHRRPLAVALLCVPLGINLLGIASIDPAAAFQSPYWDRLPLDSSALLDVLRDNGVTAVWINHWAGQPLMLDAAARGQPLLAYDWYDVQAGGIDRFPEYLPLVRAAPTPAFVLVTSEDHPALLQRLQQLGVTYRALRAPPYLVVIPVSRRVDPAEVTSALDYRY